MPGEYVDDKGHIDEALPRADVGEVRHPERIWPFGTELAVNLIQRARLGLVADRSLDRLAAYDTLQPQSPHQPLHRAARYHHALPQELPPDLTHAVGLKVLLPDPLDMPT